MRISVRVNSDKLLRRLEALEVSEREVTDALEDGGDVLRREFLARDHRNLAHGDWVVERRDMAVAVGPTRERGFIVRFWEWGTRYLRAEPLMRPALDDKRDEIVDTVARSLRRRLR